MLGLICITFLLTAVLDYIVATMINNVIDPQQDPLHIEFVAASRMECDQQRKLFHNELLMRNLVH